MRAERVGRPGNTTAAAVTIIGVVANRCNDPRVPAKCPKIDIQFSLTAALAVDAGRVAFREAEVTVSLASEVIANSSSSSSC